MMTAVGNAQLNVLGWVGQLLLGRKHFEKPIEMMIVCVLRFVHYDLDHEFHGHAAVEDVDEQNKDQSDDNDRHLEETEDLDRLDGHWSGMMIHDDGLVRVNLDHRIQMDDDDHLDYDEKVGVRNEMRLNSNEV